MPGDIDGAAAKDEAIFSPGGNCWRTSVADSFGWLVDGEAYFRALRESMEAARQEILIVGWDIQSRLQLVRDPEHPLYPSPLAETLQSLVESRPDLRVWVLSWDFALVYMLERELMPAYRFGWQESERLNFHLDGSHATGASHHQKFVVIDGTLAYIGGFDLTKCRWDTREHAAGEERRVDADGNSYRPFHDVQAVVSGEPARQLRELGDFRWKNAVGSALPSAPDAGDAEPLWPREVPVRGREVAVCLARTWAPPGGGDVVREVERLHLDLIRAASAHIYIENQYLTSPAVADALAERLEAAQGPAVVILLPGETSGWLEQSTMDVLRNRVLQRLRGADRHGRLRLLSPVSDDAGDGGINVHAKVMIIDERYVRIGSANLSRRSMGLDSECDIVAQDRGEGIAMAFLADLLGEHLGTDPDTISASVRDAGLLETIERLNGGPRRLTPLNAEDVDYQEVLEPIAEIADLERPIEETWREVVDEQASAAGSAVETVGSRAGRLLGRLGSPAVRWAFLAALILAVVVAAAFAARNSGTDLDPASMLAALREAAGHPLAPLAVVPAFIAGSLVVAPVTAMIALCALVFDPWVASLAAIAGTLAATAVNHEIGRHLGRVVAGRAPRSLIERMRSLGRSSDAWSLAGLRLIPLAPFTVINLLAGASHVPLRDFLLGTLLGMGPGTVLICFSVDRARAALAGEPIFEPWLVVVIAAAGVALIGMRLLQQRRER